MTEIGHKWVKGETVPVDLIEMPDGTFARSETYDKSVWSDVNAGYAWLPMEGERVLDVGVNVGFFSALAVRSGAAAVMGFEPDPHSFALAKRNAPTADLRMAALVSGDETEITLWQPASGYNSGRSSTTRKIHTGRPLKVPATNWSAAIDEFRPTVIKMDCEGAEYDLLKDGVPDGVKAIVLELHYYTEEQRSQAADLALYFGFEGWEAVVQPTFKGKVCVAGWRR